MSLSGKEYLDKIYKLCEAYYKQLMLWYEKEKDMSLVPDSVVAGFLGLISSLYLTFSYEMEEIDKWYAWVFDIVKFHEVNEWEELEAIEAGVKMYTPKRDRPLSDKSVDQKIKLTDKGRRMITLERRLQALKFAKEAVSRSVQARIEANKKYGGV